MEKGNGKSNQVFTWLFDEREDEREVGKTVDVNEKYLIIGDKVITLLDTPGHQDLVPVMISGASNCDYGILMVDCEKTSFETGFSYGGRTKEHVKLLNSIGPKGLFIVINKMDMVDWSEDSFEYVKGRLQAFLEAEGIDNIKHVEYFPVSALTGENMSKPIGKKAPWWKGGTIADKLSRQVD